MYGSEITCLYSGGSSVLFVPRYYLDLEAPERLFELLGYRGDEPHTHPRPRDKQGTPKLLE